MKIYISGKITGTTDYIKRFERAEKALSNYIVINPDKVNFKIRIYLKNLIKLLTTMFLCVTIQIQ